MLVRVLGWDVTERGLLPVRSRHTPLASLRLLAPLSPCESGRAFALASCERTSAFQWICRRRGSR